MKLKDSDPWKKSYDQPRQHIKKQKDYCANKGLSTQGYGFSSSHVWIWELDYEESWVLNNWCSWTVVLEETLGSPLDCKDIQRVHPKGDQCWIFIGRTDVEAETPIVWPPDATWGCEAGISTRSWSCASQEENSLENLTMLALWSGNSSLQNCEQINFCFLNYPVYIFGCGSLSRLRASYKINFSAAFLIINLCFVRVCFIFLRHWVQSSWQINPIVPMNVDCGIIPVLSETHSHCTSYTSCSKQLLPYYSSRHLHALDEVS